MQRARRAAAVAVVAMTGGLMLAGCQSQPSVAAYVGSTQISVDRVNTIVEELNTAVTQRQQPIPDESYGNARQLVLEDLIFVEVAKRYVKSKGLSDPAVDVDNVAQQYQLPTSLSFVALEAQAGAYHTMLLNQADPSAPTDADLHDVYDRAPHGPATFDQIKEQLQGLQGLPAAIGLRNDLRNALTNDKVVVNPQYRGTEIPLYNVQTGDGTTFTAVALNLGTAGGDNSDFITS